MSDILRMLRCVGRDGILHSAPPANCHPVCSLAADRITRLEADRVELIEALKGAVKWALVSDDPRSTKDLHAAEAVLRRIQEN